MRFGLLSALALGLLTAGAGAQIVGNNPGKQQKDGDIEFTSRSSLPGTIAGRLSTHLCAGYWAGTRQVASFTMNFQDQNDATPETFLIEIRNQDATTALPDWPSAAPALATGNYTIPVGTGTIVAFQVTFTPATPINLPSGQPFYLCVLVPVQAAWAADGGSCHMSAGLSLPCGTSGNPACCGSVANPTLGGWESPKGVPASQVNLENVAPADTPAGILAFASRDRNYFHWVQTTQPTLTNLAIDPTAGSNWFCPISNPNSGHAAMHPDVNDFLASGRRDRLGWKVNGGLNYASGLSLVFISRNCLETAIPVGFGDLYVDPFDPLFNALIQGPIALDGAGIGTVTDNFLPGNEAIVDGIGDLHCQALAINSSFATFELTNLDTFGFTLAGGTAFTVDAATPVSVLLTGQSQIRLKNNGHGTIRAEYRNGTVVLGAMNVRERTTGAGFIAPGATSVVIVSTNTNANATNPTRGEHLIF